MASKSRSHVVNRRQKQQLTLTFDALAKGEAPREAKRAELPATTTDLESPADDVMEQVLERGNLLRALKKVKRGGKSPGVDGMALEALPAYLVENWPRIREELRAGTYRPMPVKRVEIDKPDGGKRKLGIPSVLDRFIQQAILQVLQSRWDPSFSEYSYGFRPGRSQHQAIAKAQEFISAGYGVVVDTDIEKFFDRVQHDRLMSEVAKRESDRRIHKIIRAYLSAGVMEGGLVEVMGEGTPQGGPLSPLLSNLVLDELDRELTKRGLRFVRYADDCNIYVKSERAGNRVLSHVKSFLASRLKLTVNEKKSAVARPHERKFLGFTFTRESQPRRTIAPKSLERCRERVREITRRTRGRSFAAIVGELRDYLTGWKAYFGFAETVSRFKELQGWIRHRLRSLAWKQWKTTKRRREMLESLGVNKRLARQTAGSPKGPWPIANSKALTVGLSNAHLRSLGLPDLYVEA